MIDDLSQLCFDLVSDRILSVRPKCIRADMKSKDVFGGIYGTKVVVVEGRPSNVRKGGDLRLAQRFLLKDFEGRSLRSLAEDDLPLFDRDPVRGQVYS